MAAFRKKPWGAIPRGVTVDADSWEAVVDDLEPRPLVPVPVRLPAASTETWWQGGSYVGADWRSRLEFLAVQAKALNASEAWWAQGRLSYEWAKLEAELGHGHYPAAMVTLG
jgi:hypothetical protein